MWGLNNEVPEARNWVAQIWPRMLSDKSRNVKDAHSHTDQYLLNK